MYENNMWFVIQVRPGKEEDFRRGVQKTLLEKVPLEIVIPIRKVRDRKAQKIQDRDAVVFPGYVFVLSAELDAATVRNLRGVEWFYRWLGQDGQPTPLPDTEARLLQTLLTDGERIGLSTVSFDESNKIQVVAGPLKGLAGLITKVDRRKRRARVRLDMYEKAFEVDFGFELLAGDA